MTSRKRLVVIDGKSVFYRGYYAMPGLSLPDGTPTGGVFGFASIALQLIDKLQPDYVAIAWDKAQTSINKRLEVYPEYKAGRTKPPEDFYAQIPLLHELLAAFGWPIYEMDDYEADDIMGSFARQAEKQGIETCIVTGDYDMLQLISDMTHVYITKKGTSQLVQYDSAAFTKKYGVRVNQFIDYKALVGDSSDNIPGVAGIGPVAAQKLLSQYETLDGIYAHLDELPAGQQKKLTQNKDNAYISKTLAAIFEDAPITLKTDDAAVTDSHYDAVVAILKKFSFHSLLRRLPAQLGETATDAVESTPNQAIALKKQPWPKNLQVDSEKPLFMGVNQLTKTVWLSVDETSYYEQPITAVDASVWLMCQHARLVAHDTKQLYHLLRNEGVKFFCEQFYDVNQAAFLLNPLVRDRSLSALSGIDVDEADSGAVALQLRAIYAAQQEKFAHLPELYAIATDYDFPLQYVLFEMERRGVKIDTSLLSDMSQQLAEQITSLEQQIYSYVDEPFNIASPAQLAEVLFTKLELPTTGIKKGKTGYSTGQKELNKLRSQHPIIELVEQVRELSKLKNTYVDALPKLADETSRLHSTFHQDVVSTGRLASSNPNLQNIPIRSEAGRRIRNAFIASEGNVLVSADYSQFELRLAAALAGDKALIDDFNSGVDIHTKTASDVYGVDLEAVTKEQRRDAKVINFGVLYGMSPHGLSAATGMDFTTAKHFIEHYFEVRQPIRKFIDATLTQAHDDGYVQTRNGRRRPTPDVRSSNFMVREAAKRAAANMPIQGTEADLMKKAMLRVAQLLRDKDGAWGEQVVQIHDSIMIECPRHVADEVASTLQSVMESIDDSLGVKLQVDVSIGASWAEL